MYLECWAPVRGRYPDALPAASVRATGAAPGVLLAVTQALAKLVPSLRGEPMVYELASAAVDALPQVCASGNIGVLAVLSGFCFGCLMHAAFVGSCHVLR